MSYHNDMAELEQELAQEQRQTAAEAKAFRNIKQVMTEWSENHSGEDTFFNEHVRFFLSLMKTAVTDTGGEW